MSFNRNHGLLFGAMVPEDFFSESTRFIRVTSRTETNFIKYLSRDLQVLLKMPFNHFISHVLCDENFQKTIQTFFLYAPRMYDPKRTHHQQTSSLLDAYSTIAPIYSLLFHVYYRLVMDSAGQTEFSKAVPAFGGLGKNYWEVVCSKGVLNVITFVDWCCLLGEKNQGILNELIDHVESQRAVFHDEIIGFFMEVNGKLEDMANRLLDEGESKANRSEYVLFVRDIINCCSTFIQCVPKVRSYLE